jgi:Repeat of unknown function (DUF346)
MPIVRRGASRCRQFALHIGAVAVVVLYLASNATSASALPERFFGMTAQESMNDSEPDWEALQNAGVQKFRMQIKWKTINDAGGGNWKTETGWQNTYDRYFEKAAKHGIAILPYIYTRKDGNQAYYLVGGANYTEWLEFVWTVVQRYGQAGSFWFKHLSLPQYPVDTWEVWNEPNLSANCPSGACNGKQYGEFLVGTSKTIHQAQEAYGYVPKVLFGGLYQERWNYSITNYLAAAGLAPGIKTAYDGLSIHPYAFGQETEHHNYSEKASGVWSNIDGAYNAQFNGIGVLKPLWVTEVGWPITGTGADHVTEGEQAGLLSETYNWIKQHWSEYNIKYAAWFDYKDFSSDPGTRWDQHAGLRDVNGVYRESWYSYEAETGVQEWPPRWHTDNLGGNITQSPDIASWGSGRLDVFGRNPDGSLAHKWWNGSAWSSWETIGSPGMLASGVGASGAAGKEINVVGRSPSNAVVDEWWNGSTWQFVNFGGNIKGVPDFASPMNGAGANVWAWGTKDTLEHRWWTGSAWSPWTVMDIPEGSGIGVPVASSPGASSWGAGRTDVFTRAPNGSVQDAWWDGTQSQITNIGGLIEGAPTVASWAPGRLDVFVKGTDNALWSNWYENGEWHSWHSIGGNLASDPGAVSWGNGRIDVVARLANGTIQHWWWQQ